MARLYWVRDLTNHATGTVDGCDEEEKEESTAMERSQPERKLVDQAMEEFNVILVGVNVWGKDSAWLAPPYLLREFGYLRYY